MLDKVKYHDAEVWLKANGWPVCDHNLDCVVNNDIKGLMSESDILDAEAEASAWREEQAMLGDFEREGDYQ